MSYVPGVLPDAIQRLLLRAALSDGDGARRAWEDWRQAGGDIDTVDPAAFGLLPLVYRNLEANRVEDPDMPRMKGVYRHAWVANQRTAQRLGPALDALRRTGIPTLVLNGAAVGVAHYRDAGARRIDDVGVLVPPGETKRALAVLRAGGWSVPGRMGVRRALRRPHTISLVEPDGAQVALYSRVLVESSHDRDFWSGAVPASVGRASTKVPGPTEQLLHTCAFGVRAGPPALTWIADAAVIIRDAGAEIDWLRLTEGAAQREITPRTTAALAALRELLPTLISERAMAELTRGSVTA